MIIQFIKKLLLAVTSIVLASTVTAQNITNARFEQDGNKVRVSYTLDKKTDIEIRYSTDGGVTYSGRLKAVTGDVGGNVLPGNNVIIWSPLDEGIEISSQRVCFKISSGTQESLQQKSSKSELNTFVLANLAYSNSPQLSYGITIGIVKRWGFYLSANTNGKFYHEDFSVDNDGTTDSDYNISYQFDGELYSRLNVTGGAVVRVYKPICVYAGLGYGYRTLLWSTTNGDKAKVTSHSHSGLSAEVGLLLAAKHFSMSAGITTVDKNYRELKVGIGLAF